MNGGGGEFLLDAIAGGFVFDRGNGDDVNGFGQRGFSASDVVATR